MQNIKIKFNFSDFIDLELPLNTVVVSAGLQKHLVSSRHENMIKYLPRLERLLNQPDYVGRNPKQPRSSLEVITCLDDNVLVAVKLDKKNGRYFVASVYDVTDSKLNHMIKSGRVVKVDKN